VTETESTLMNLNYYLAEKVRELAEISTLIDYVMVVLAEYGAYLLPITLIILFLLRGKHRKDSLFVFFTTILAIEISYIVSELYYHPRPFEMYDTLLSRVPQNTFPSQHASTLFPFAFALLYRNKKTLGIFFLAWASINAFARIYVGFHFPLDIVAGIIIGILSVGILKQLEVYMDNFSEWTEKKQNLLQDKLSSKARQLSSSI